MRDFLIPFSRENPAPLDFFSLDFFPLESSICSAVVFPQFVNSNYVAISVYIDFPSSLPFSLCSL